jgi:hypothetical protein
MFGRRCGGGRPNRRQFRSPVSRTQRLAKDRRNAGEDGNRSAIDYLPYGVSQTFRHWPAPRVDAIEAVAAKYAAFGGPAT